MTSGPVPPSEDDIRTAIEEALDAAKRAASDQTEPPVDVNARRYRCSRCFRLARARGLCNAHYVRWRRALPLDTPHMVRQKNQPCRQCGASISGKRSGWGLCSTHYKAKRKVVVKQAIIDAMGGQCYKCGGKFPRAVFDFHHRGDKMNDPSALISTAAPARIAAELVKCDLLCANCHRAEHVNGTD